VLIQREFLEENACICNKYKKACPNPESQVTTFRNKQSKSGLRITENIQRKGFHDQPTSWAMKKHQRNQPNTAFGVLQKVRKRIEMKILK
jgi:hypothetical protein